MFYKKDLTGDEGRIDKVGFVLPPFTSATVVDNLGHTWNAKGQKQMDGFGRCYEYDSAKSVTITFSSTISGTLNLAAQVARRTVVLSLQDRVLLYTRIPHSSPACCCKARISAHS
jgi:hypothetical protein